MSLAHEPTNESRAIVSNLAAFGIRQESIARQLGISKPTLEKYYREELEHGLDDANAKVANTLFSMAVSGEHPAATFFWLKTRAGWRETDRDNDAKDYTVNNVPVKTT